jgi:hypothetical protein
MVRTTSLDYIVESDAARYSEAHKQDSAREPKEGVREPKEDIGQAKKGAREPKEGSARGEICM